MTPMALFGTAAFSLSLAAGMAAAQDTVSTPGTREGLEVTIYHGNLAQVRDLRTMTLPAGTHRLILNEVSPGIIAQTARVTAGGMQILEMNFDYDLLTPQKLLEKAVGSRVRVYRAHPNEPADRIEEAVVLAANNGAVLQFDDRIEVLDGDTLPGRIVFDEIPENLRARPSLSSVYQLDAPFEGPLEMTYLTCGLGWETDYVATYDEGAGTMDMKAWVTLSNSTGISYEDTQLNLVAGSPNDAYDTGYRRESRPQADAPMVTGSRMQREELADYHLYTVPFPVDILNNQTKQAELFSAQDVQVDKVYTATDYGNPRPARQNAQWQLRFANEEEAGLGFPLPAGVFGVYQSDTGGAAQFVGSDDVSGTPVGQDVEVTLGAAFDVTYEGRILSSTLPEAGVRETATEVTFSNARTEDITVEYAFHTGRDSRIVDASLPYEGQAAGVYVFEVPVAARSATVLAITYRMAERD